MDGRLEWFIYHKRVGGLEAVVSGEETLETLHNGSTNVLLGEHRQEVLS